MASILETVGPRAGAAPLTYTLSEEGTVDVMSVFAEFNGAAASGDFLPVLTVRAQNGAILGRVFAPEAVAAGDSADVTFAPFLKTGSGGGHVIEDEGTPLPQRAALDFTGVGVTAADSAGKTVVTIPGVTALDIGARAYMSGNQSIPDSSGSGAWTGINLNLERFDTDSIHSIVSNTSRFTANTAGKYLCWLSAFWSANASGYRDVAVYSDTLAPNVGAGFVGRDYLAAPPGNVDVFQRIAVVHNLGVGNYVEFQARQASGIALDLYGGLIAYATEAGITRLG